MQYKKHPAPWLKHINHIDYSIDFITKRIKAATAREINIYIYILISFVYTFTSFTYICIYTYTYLVFCFWSYSICWSLSQGAAWLASIFDVPEWVGPHEAWLQAVRGHWQPCCKHVKLSKMQGGNNFCLRVGLCHFRIRKPRPHCHTE